MAVTVGVRVSVGIIATVGNGVGVGWLRIASGRSGDNTRLSTTSNPRMARIFDPRDVDRVVLGVFFFIAARL